MVHSGTQMQIEGSGSANNNLGSNISGEDNEITPRFTDAFTIAASILASIVLVMSFIYYRKSKHGLKSTLDLLKPQ
jgi:copper transport protein